MRTQILLITILGLLFCNYCFSQQEKLTLKEKMRLVDNTRKNSYLDPYVDSILNSYFKYLYIYALDDFLLQDTILISDSVESATNVSFLEVTFKTGEKWMRHELENRPKKRTKASSYRELQLREQIWFRKEFPYEMINKYNLGLLIFDNKKRLISAEYDVKPVGNEFEINKRKIEYLSGKNAEIQKQKLVKAWESNK